jgi:uncharacterized protein YcbK (DUF882 family)
MGIPSDDKGGRVYARSPRPGILRGPLLAAALCLGLCVIAAYGAMAGKEAEKGGKVPGDQLFILWNGFRVSAEEAAILVAPATEQVIGFVAGSGGLDVQALSCKGTDRCECRGSTVIWTAPSKPGNYWLEIKLEVKPEPGDDKEDRERAAEKSRDKKIKLACLVGTPSSKLKNGYINGFEIGKYPDPSRMSNPDLHRPPDYFYYLEKKVLGRFISDNVRLGDLGYDGRAPLPQYIALDYELVKKLELLKSELISLDLPSRFHFVGGGFISPKSNKKRTRKSSAAADLSRHMWGEAADFYIDEDPLDEIMDDMNQDGVIDVRDAFFIRDILTELEESGLCTPGGVGVYSPPRNSQVQLHVDVRGFSTRWGYKDYDPEVFAGQAPKKSLKPGG